MLSLEAALVAYAHLAVLASASSLTEPSLWAPSSISFGCCPGLLVISSPARSLLPGKSCFLKPSVDGLCIDRGPGVATATPMSRCPPLCVCRSIWRRHCVWSLSLPRVAEAGGVTLATLMAPWRRDPDRSPFLRSGKCGGSYSLYVAEAWGGGRGVDGQCLTYLNFTLTSLLPCPTPPSVWFSSFSCKRSKFCSSC